MVNASDFNALATRTANCLLGIDCGTDAATDAGTDADAGKNIKQSMEAALNRMAEDNKQLNMNKNSKGSYFLIFILFLLLLGFSLDKEE